MSRNVVSICLLIGFFVVSCSSGNSSNFEFYNTVREVGPKITTSSSSENVQHTKHSAAWSMGNPLYDLYGLLQDYQFPRDEGKIDGSNMWKAMFEADTRVSNSLTQCQSITDVSVTSPFDFGSDSISATYNCNYDGTDSNESMGTTYLRSYVSKADGTKLYALLGDYLTESGQTSPSATQIYYDSATNDIVINNTYLVVYTDNSYYSVRIYINGNKTTNLFSLKLIKYPNVSIAAYGYAKGSDTYYLARVLGVSGPTDQYYCFKSETTEAELQAMEGTGTTLEAVSENCTAFKDKIPTPYNIDGSESAKATTDFTGGGDSRIILQH